MSAAKIILAAAAVGIGLVVLSRSSAASVGTPTPPTAPGFGAGTSPTFANFGPVVPQLGPAYAVLKPIADNVTTPLVHSLNRAVGGASPYGALKANADGTYTDGLGATITPNADGTYTRKNPSWTQTNGGRVIVTAASTVQGAAEDVGHFVSGLL